MRALIFTTLMCATLAGCNTVAGVGEDITGTARWFQGNLPQGY